MDLIMTTFDVTYASLPIVFCIQVKYRLLGTRDMLPYASVERHDITMAKQ